MKHIVLTEVDAKTKVPCTVEPQRTGPSMPKIKGLVLDWVDKSTWPVELGPTWHTFARPSITALVMTMQM
jgi:hypothetical protein